MKNINILKNISFGFIITAFVVTACDADFMNTKPLDQVSDADVWIDPKLTEAFVTEIYRGGLEFGGFDEQMLSSLSDETVFTHPGRGINTITESRSSPADPGWINEPQQWDDMYRMIRACNLALKNLEEPLFDDPELVKRLKGEVHFLRGYYYHQLLRFYGGVPLIDRVYELGEEDYTIERNTFAETVGFIVKDADAAATFLNGLTPPEGRASEAAALALKSRVLLYAASDLHDIATASTKSSVIAGFSKPELLGYLDGDRTERWQKAKAAAKAVLDLSGYGYMLDLTAPATAEEAIEYHNSIALARNGGESELLWARYFIDAKDEQGAWVGRNNGPSGYHNWAGNTPLQNLVDDYHMMDGTEFNWEDPNEAAAPYENREPRFYATILYDGADWKPRTADIAARDPNNQIQTGQYEVVNNEGKVVLHNGLDTRLPNTVEDWNGTHTGYYMRKFIDPDPSINNQTDRQQVPWPFFRYTEAVLNYVEACIELHEDAEAREWLDKIRFRAGMPAITESGAALMEQYRFEREKELVFEEHRFHDVRRWMIAAETIGETPQIIKVSGELKPGETVTTYHYDPEKYIYTYEVSDLPPGIENRLWLDKMYYFPIHRDEINRNDKLVQNPGYSD